MENSPSSKSTKRFRHDEILRTPPASPSKRNKQMLQCPGMTLDTIQSTVPKEIRTSNIEDSPGSIVNKISFELDEQGVPTNEFFLETPDQIHQGRQSQSTPEQLSMEINSNPISTFKLQYRSMTKSRRSISNLSGLKSPFIELDGRGRNRVDATSLYQPSYEQIESNNISPYDPILI